MKWPRGKYNGRRIVGFDVRARLDLLVWSWCLPDRYGRCMAVGPLRVWFSPAYEYPQR
jgi:hypothetical protein